MAVPGTLADIPTSESIELSSSWGCTQLQMKKFSFTWTIHNFSCYPQETGTTIKSPEFMAGVSDEHRFRLKLSLINENNKDFVSLDLDLLSIKSDDRIQFGFLIMNNGTETLGKLDEHFYYLESSGRGYKQFIEKTCLFDKKLGHLLDDKLTILCKGIIASNTINIAGKKTSRPFDVPDCMALNNLGLLFDEQKFGDVTLAIDERELRAHKVILAAQSAVFAAMFEHEMAEQKENRVEIVDIDFEVFEEMLRFIYTGKAKNLNKMAARLLVAADKYQLNRLKVMCENELAATLAIENALDILILADLHDARQLKAVAMDFIVSRPHDFVEDFRLKSQLGLHPLLAVETLCALAKQQVPKVPRTEEY